MTKSFRGNENAGNLVDVWLSKTRDMEWTKAFFVQAIEYASKNVATDGLASYLRAIAEELGEDVEH